MKNALPKVIDIKIFGPKAKLRYYYLSKALIPKNQPKPNLKLDLSSKLALIKFIL